MAYAYGNDALLLVLADGMGGHLHGELAARLATETLVELFPKRNADPQTFLKESMKAAHRRIMELPQNEDHAFPGTTCVAAFVKDGKLYWGHAGDSRLYLFRKGEMIAKSVDHSIVQLWLQAGLIDEATARVHPRRNQITNCLGGVEDMFEIELGKPVELEPGDVVLLCSDGFWSPLNDEEMAKLSSVPSLADRLEELIDLAVYRDAVRADNTTAVVARIGDAEEEHVSEVPMCVMLDERPAPENF